MTLMKKKMILQEEDEEDRVVVDEGGWAPNFHWLTDDLAVGGSFPSDRTEELARDHAIAAVIDLREENCDDELLLREHGVAFLHLPTPDIEAASIDMLDRGVRFAREHRRRGNKVLIHCQHGIGRSVLLSLCVLVDRGWDPLEAVRHV